MTLLNNVLRIDASARENGSVSRELGDETIDRLAEIGPTKIVRRDLSAGIPFVDEEWVGANFTAPESRTDAQKAKLAYSDSLVEELQAADTIVIATPIYNFGIPASLKAWVDMIARARLTFRYTENGPVGLLTGKRAIILVASGGTPIASAMDFATPYLKHVLGFVGITDVEIIAADALGGNGVDKRKAASAKIQALTSEVNLS